ncbi:hydrolase [Deltaproteobacteria bacterium]|nr:hydrolase [Deltaproteobacteria bacterium]
MALDPNRYQLVIIDIQEKLAGAMPEASRARGLRAAENLVFAARELDMPLTFTEQYPQGLGPTVASLAAADPFVKTAFAATDEPGFDQCLHAGRTLVLAGMETHICVAHTALGLRASGHEVVVVPDACVSRREDDWRDGIAWMRSAGVTVLPSETLLFGWLGRAGGPLFKEISRRIR